MIDIADVAEASGVKPSALRYYEKIGLIEAVGRNGLRRQYDHDVLLRLSLIAMGKSAGFELEEIASLFRLAPVMRLPRRDIEDKAVSLEAEIERLQTLARLMRHVANCPEDNHFDCPRFRKLLRVTIRSQKKTR